MASLLTRRGQLRVTDKGIAFPEPPSDDVSSVDIAFNGHRAWSIDLISNPANRERKLHAWPRALAPLLNGTAHVEVRDSTDDRLLWSTDAHLGKGSTPIDVVDATGRHVAVNKWGRLGKSFEGDETGLQERLLDKLDAVVAVMQELGHRPFVVGGTLLGAFREGKVLPHDDDADLAYLSEHSHPADLALEAYQIERDLVARGYEVLRHSSTHHQLIFRRDDGLVDGYVDVFTAFFRDGYINQPFHVRGEMAESSMLPLSTVTLEGRDYPAPAKPDDWLVVNYDENWRTPLPGYKLGTPRSTKRRFEGWFGNYQFQHDFWEDRYLYVPDAGADPDLRGVEALDAVIDGGSPVVDLGCGVGRQAKALAARGHEVLAIDAAHSALHRARRDGDHGIEWLPLNLIDPRQSAELLDRIGRSDRPVHAHATHLVERLGHHGRMLVWRLLRQYVHHDGQVALTFDTRPAAGVNFRDPSTWHLTAEQIDAELRPLGLALTGVTYHRDTRRDKERRTATAFLTTTKDEK